MTRPTPPTGSKRLCQVCTARFYDLNKRPIICPKCASVQNESGAIVS